MERDGSLPWSLLFILSQIRGIAANVLNNQLLTADKRWSSSLGIGCGDNSSPQTNIVVTKYHAVA
jgi:hypothetical protein